MHGYDHGYGYGYVHVTRLGAGGMRLSRVPIVEVKGLAHRFVLGG